MTAFFAALYVGLVYVVLGAQELRPSRVRRRLGVRRMRRALGRLGYAILRNGLIVIRRAP